MVQDLDLILGVPSAFAIDVPSVVGTDDSGLEEHSLPHSLILLYSTVHTF